MQDDQDDDDLELAPELEMIEYEEEQQAIHDPGQLTEQLQAVEREIAQVERSISSLLARQQELRAKRDDLARRLQNEKRAPRQDWAHAKFPWDADVLSVLRSAFGLQGFRPLQREVINASLQGRDTFVLLPSGGGKSLCYQLPAIIGCSSYADSSGGGQAAGSAGGKAGGWVRRPGLTLVISPLLSLIYDQVSALKALGVSAAALTSHSTDEEQADVYARLTAAASAASGKGKSSFKSKSTQAAAAAGAASEPLVLLYVTPERVVQSKRFMGKLEKVYEAGLLARIAVDEVHCASAWGQDFRPDYKKLSVLRTLFKDTPIMALTATATRQVQEDVMKILCIQGAELFSASINRPNLFYEVAYKPPAASSASGGGGSKSGSTTDGLSAAIAPWVRTHYPAGESGIVYALTRKDCETLAAELESLGVTAVHYHADMEVAARQAAHDAWGAGAAQVVVATVAFGMGINKADVRFVIHATISKSVENYYQESGRAGRDGAPAHCLLLYRFSDVLRQAAVVCYEHNWWRHLSGMAQYASALAGCRRAALQGHFAEAPSECRRMCDCCLTAAEPIPADSAQRPDPAGDGGEGGGGKRKKGSIKRPEAGASAAAAGGGPEEVMPPEVDVGHEAGVVLRVLRGLAAAGKKATLLQLLDGWRKEDKASAKAWSKEQQEQVVEAMLLRWGLLELDFGVTAYATNVYLKPTARGHSLLDAAERQQQGQGDVSVPGCKLRLRRVARPDANGGTPVVGTRMLQAVGPEVDGAPQAAAPQGANQLLDKLRQWRGEEAQAAGVFPACVATDAQLERLADLRAQGIAGTQAASVAGTAQASSTADAAATVLGQERAACYTQAVLAVMTGGVKQVRQPAQQQQQQQAAQQSRRPTEVVVLSDSEDGEVEAEGEEGGRREEAGPANAKGHVQQGDSSKGHKRCRQDGT